MWELSGLSGFYSSSSPKLRCYWSQVGLNFFFVAHSEMASDCGFQWTYCVQCMILSLICAKYANFQWHSLILVFERKNDGIPSQWMITRHSYWKLLPYHLFLNKGSIQPMITLNRCLKAKQMNSFCRLHFILHSLHNTYFCCQTLSQLDCHYFGTTFEQQHVFVNTQMNWSKIGKTQVIEQRLDYFPAFAQILLCGEPNDSGSASES